MRYRLVIFDFDGTLADSFEFFASVVNDLADRFRFRRIDPSEYETLRHYSAAQMIRHVGLPLWKIPQVGRHFQSLMAESIHRIPLFAGVDRTLRNLSDRGISLAVVSSNTCSNVQRVLGPELEGLIAFYECGVSVFGKQTKFRRILKRSGVPRSEAIYIADEIRDLESARQAGIAFGAVSWGYTNVEALKKLGPDEVFATVEEIAEKVA
jgi:phosphoglycolate phosphatase